MQLIASWKDSLTLFKPANFKLFLLVTLKSLKDTYKVWILYWGWLLIFILFWELLTRFIMASSSIIEFILMFPYGINKMLLPFLFSGPILLLPSLQGHLLGVSWLATSYFVVFLLYLTFFLCARASVKIKNFSYFKDYVIHAFYLMIWFFLLSLLLVGYLIALAKIIGAKGYGVEFLLSAYIFFMMTWSLVFISFTLDSDARLTTVFKSIGRSLKFVLYNLPACLIFALLFLCLYILGIVSLVGIFYIVPPNMILGKLFTVFFISLLVCVATNYYIKRIHDQFTVYFGK